MVWRFYFKIDRYILRFFLQHNALYIFIMCKNSFSAAFSSKHSITFVIFSHGCVFTEMQNDLLPPCWSCWDSALREIEFHLRLVYVGKKISWNHNPLPPSSTNDWVAWTRLAPNDTRSELGVSHTRCDY